MKLLRIVFMGTPDFAVASLRKLIDHSCDVVGVVTAPDRPAGRGRKIKASPVKEYALAQGLPVLQPQKLKDPAFLEELSELKADLFVIVAFRMLPREVWQMPEYGTFNLHASLLPDYRGAAPINWAIINGETETGVTTFFIDDKIDTGAIIYQESTAISEQANAGDLHDLLMDQGAELVLKTVKAIESGQAESKVQPEGRNLRSAPKIHKETCEINWNKPGKDIYNHIRGLSPYPAAWTTLINGEEETGLKIYSSTFVPANHQLKIGSVITTKKDLRVAVRDGYLQLLEMQLAGKRKMQVSDLLNGLNLEKNAQMV
ncbi:methionyl-tRNA formyltransferase [Poritiphilus flavus]|uniref:methionyl-tRNA formyltransferase n=1 Tax=Poritiphilus flavus TaxID=2697053 RepID=UPI001EEC9999|nr:methionyl-tRNA formyltransferase [Poritiphilus flavus]